MNRRKNKQRKPADLSDASPSLSGSRPQAGLRDDASADPIASHLPVTEVSGGDIPTQVETPDEVVIGAIPADTDSQVIDPEMEEAPVEPTLAAYFGKEPVKIASFVKAVKTADRKRFDLADMAVADELIATNDRDGVKLWLLATNAAAAPAIEAWVWPHIRNRMTHIVGRDVDFFATSPTEILRMLVARSSSSIQQEDRFVQKSSEINLRLGVAWLIEKRGLETLAAAEVLKSLFLEKPKDAEKRIRRAISQGTRSEMRTAVTALSLADERVRSATGERDEERHQKQVLRDRLEAVEQKARQQADDIVRLEALKAELQAALDEERRRAENADRHAGHDMSQMRADFSVSLRRVKRHSKLTPDRRAILTPLAGKGLRSGPLIAQP